EGFTRERDAIARSTWSLRLHLGADRLGPVGASRVFLCAIQNESSIKVRPKLVEDLAALTGFLATEDAVRTCGAAAQFLSNALKTESDMQIRGELARDLAILAMRLEPTEGVRLCRQAISGLILEKESGFATRLVHQNANDLVLVAQRL